MPITIDTETRHEELAEFLVNARARLHITRPALAARLRLSLSTYHKYEEGRSKPRGTGAEEIRQAVETMIDSARLPWM